MAVLAMADPLARAILVSAERAPKDIWGDIDRAFQNHGKARVLSDYRGGADIGVLIERKRIQLCAQHQDILPGKEARSSCSSHR